MGVSRVAELVLVKIGFVSVCGYFAALILRRFGKTEDFSASRNLQRVLEDIITGDHARC